jgi:hypothetical protein
MLKGTASYSGVSLLARWNRLRNNIAVSNVYGGWATEKLYTFTVPTTSSIISASFQISGGTGDADIYVRYNSPPTTGLYDCRPYIGGNNETCTFDYPSSGTYYVLVRGYTAYTGVSLMAWYEQDTTTCLQPVCPLRGAEYETVNETESEAAYYCPCP